MAASENVINAAFLHIEVDEGQFYVRGIAIVGQTKDRTWYLFPKEDQLPSSHPLVEGQINKLRVKHFRNLKVADDKLSPYLSENKKSFVFKGNTLVADLDKSIKETVEQEEEEPEEPKKKKMRTSTPKFKPCIVAKRPLCSDSAPSFEDFLKGVEFIKKLKIPMFDPYQGCSAEWLSNFEKEFRQHASVEDIGYTHLLHLLKTDEAKKWHFKYRFSYTDWSSFKKAFIEYFELFHIKKLFELKASFDVNKQTLQQFATSQMKLWSSFFPTLNQNHLNTAVVSGLSNDFARQLSHYVSSPKDQFLEYCQMLDSWKGMDDSKDEEEEDYDHFFDHTKDKEDEPDNAETQANVQKAKEDAIARAKAEVQKEIDDAVAEVRATAAMEKKTRIEREKAAAIADI